MKIPSYIILYDGRKKLKAGSECPKYLEEILQKAIDSKMVQAQKLGEHFAPYDNENKIIKNCSQYPEFNKAVLTAYKEARKSKPKATKKEKDK